MEKYPDSLIAYPSKDHFEVGVEYRNSYFHIGQIQTDTGHLLRSPFFGPQDTLLIPLTKGVTFCYCEMDTSRSFSVVQNPDQSAVVTLSFLLQGQLEYGHHPRNIREIHGGFAFLDTVSEAPSLNNVPANARILSVDLHFEEEKYIEFLMQMLESGVIAPENEKILLRPAFYQDTLTHFSPDIHRVFLQILNCPYHGSRRDFYLKMKITEILFHYFSELQTSRNLRQKTGEMSASKSKKERLHEIAEYLRSCPVGNIEMQDLARISGMSETSLQLAFKKHFGFSVMQYHKKMVLKRAYDLLLQGENIKTTAHLCGYSHTASFSKAFYKEFGIRPSKL